MKLKFSFIYNPRDINTNFFENLKLKTLKKLLFFVNEKFNLNYPFFYKYNIVLYNK